MSISKRASGRWAVLIDVEDKNPFRILESMPAKSDGRRQDKIVGKYRTAADAEKALARLRTAGESRPHVSG